MGSPGSWHWAGGRGRAAGRVASPRPPPGTGPQDAGVAGNVSVGTAPDLGTRLAARRVQGVGGRAGSDPDPDCRWPLSRCPCPTPSLSIPRNPARWKGQYETLLSPNPCFCRRFCLSVPHNPLWCWAVAVQVRGPEQSAEASQTEMPSAQSQCCHHPGQGPKPCTAPTALGPCAAE